jgi:hypothetical protein
MWHQVFLIFVQFYKNDLTENEKNQLKKLNEKIGHHAIQSEINRELNYNVNINNINNNHNKMQLE